MIKKTNIILKEKHKEFGYKIYNKPSFFRNYLTEIVIVILLIVSILSLFHERAEFIFLDVKDAGSFGEFIGGYIGTIFALFGVLLLYATFRIQRESSETEKFENKYFELIKLHRDNVAEIELKGNVGKKAFVLMFREFREIHKLILSIVKKQKLEYDLEEILCITYLVFFYGLGPNSSRMMKQSLNRYPDSFVISIEQSLINNKNRVKQARKFDFEPFEGHQSRLGHYYRHLYQTILYVEEKKINIDKYNYVKTIRAQLSNHEQALLFLNSLTPLGVDWWLKGLIIKYKIVQNIPHQFFNPQTEIEVTEYFPKDYFEWQ